MYIIYIRPATNI